MEIFETVLLKIFLPLSGLLAYLLFSFWQDRRKYFWLRLAGFVVLYIGIDSLAFLSVVFEIGTVWHFIINIISFFAVSGLLLLPFKGKYLTELFCAISGKCTMHIAEYLSKILFNFTIKSTFISIAVYAVVYVAVYFLFARRIRKEDCEHLDNIKVSVFALVILIATDVIVLCLNGTSISAETNVYFFALIAIICAVVLFLQYGILSESKQKTEQAVMRQIREQEREQYEQAKENITQIGIRQHDLKNLLESRSAGLTETDVNEIVNSIDGYELPFRTGNRTLDIILMEKHIVCKNMNIRLECIAEGAPLGFMSEMDIYSLFLNALNNAVESAKKIEDVAKRVIYLKTYTRGELLYIQVQNYFSEVVRTAKGFETTKPDKSSHGFGLLSMKNIARKYGGEMSVSTENDMFMLGFAIPIK